MGTPKAALEWHGSTLLRHVVGIVARGVRGPVIVVRAPGQLLPSLSDDIEIIEDPVEGRGPLQGLAAGLAAARRHAEGAYVSSTDMPFLHPAFVRHVAGALDGVDVALPKARGYPQPLAAAYRTDLVDTIEGLIKQDRLRPAHLFEVSRVRRLDDAELLADPILANWDPNLDSLLNVNEPGDYQDARARPAPEVTVRRFGVLRRIGSAPDPAQVHAATLAEAAREIGLELDAHIVAALNGDQIMRDGDVPLVAGDSVAFLSADGGG